MKSRKCWLPELAAFPFVFNSIHSWSIKAMIVWFWINSLLNNIISDLSKLKVSADGKLNATLKVRLYIKQENMRKCWLPTFLAPLAVGQRAYVMARCLLGVRSCVNFFSETYYQIIFNLSPWGQI